MTTGPTARDAASPLLERLYEVATYGGGVEDDGGHRSLEALLERAFSVRTALLAGAPSLAGQSVVLLATPSRAWVSAFFGILLAGGVAVPLSPLYPAAELAWFADDAGARTALVSADLAEKAALLVPGRRVLDVEQAGEGPRGATGFSLPRAREIASLLYTSGTTGKPKGAMITHQNLGTHAALLREAWSVGASDHLLHALPLHHLHGLNVALVTALLAGARARLLPRFDAVRVWEELPRATTWMGVPTMYLKLLEAFEHEGAALRDRAGGAARALRLATSGSAALPVTLAERWADIAGAVPLERYGMTEIGVGSSNPLEPGGRRTGSVGRPLPTVEHRIVHEDGSDAGDGPGELWIAGPSVFVGYLGRDDASREAFVGPWFRTGDVAVRESEGHLRLLGRTSVDILKSGGYKLSALEIEEVLRESEAVGEVSVVGIPDATWGDRVVAVVVPRRGREHACGADLLRAFAKERLPAYKVPRDVLLLDALPKNALGKVVKPELAKLVARELGKG